MQGADLSHARVTCPRCGNKIDVSRAKVHFSAESPVELADAVRRVAERRRGQDIPFPDPRATGGRSDEADLEERLSALVREKVEVTAGDVSSALGVSTEKAEELVHKMLSAGLIYETAPGRYRLA